MVLFSFIGYNFISVLGLEIRKYRFEIQALAGVVLLAVLASLFCFFNLSVHTYQVTLVFLVVTGALISLRKFPQGLKIHRSDLHLTPRKLKFRILQIAPFLSCFGFISLFQASFNDHRIAYRIGPDSFGWLDSIIFFQHNLRIADLTRSVIGQLHGTSILESLIPNHPLQFTSINQITSFTQQIESEFLIGAHRTGIPYLLGCIANLFPDQWVVNVLLGFLGFLFFIMARVALKFTMAQRNSFTLTVLASFAVVFNANFLSQTLEGGIGQFFITPFVLMVFIALIEADTVPVDLLFIITLFIALSLTSYFEALILILPIIGLVIITKWRRPILILAFDVANYFKLLVFISVAAIPISSSFIRLISSPFRYPGIGGWDQGRKPTPLDFFGLTPYLPSGASRAFGQRPGLLVFIEVLLSCVLLLLVFLKSSRPSKMLIVGFCLFYLYLFYGIYLKTNASHNNYSLWKMGAYASAIFPMILIHQNSRQNQSSNRFAGSYFGSIFQIKHPKFGFKMISVCLISSLFTSALWSVDWMSSRSLTFSSREIEFLHKESFRFDFVETGIYQAMSTLYGDIHFGTSGRVDTRRKVEISNPERPVLFIVSPGASCKNLDCAEYGVAERKRKLGITFTYNFLHFSAIETKFLD
jgi:hypothetical protein